MMLLVDELLLFFCFSEGEDLEIEDFDLIDLVINVVNDVVVVVFIYCWVKNLFDELVWVNGDYVCLY